MIFDFAPSTTKTSVLRSGDLKCLLFDFSKRI